MDKSQMIKAAEAVLFASGEPISKERLSSLFEISSKETERLMVEVIEHISNADLGFEVLVLEDSYQLASKKEFADSVKSALEMKRRTPLSPAALEVLAVVAYNQPVTKSFIEQVRGVDCSGVVSSLVEKELIEERGRLELPGRPLLYGTTKNFLRCFSLSSLDDLPSLPNKDDNYAEQLEVTEE